MVQILGSGVVEVWFRIPLRYKGLRTESSHVMYMSLGLRNGGRAGQGRWTYHDRLQLHRELLTAYLDLCRLVRAP